MSETNQYEVLNPWAESDPVPMRGISPRLDTMEGKTIGLFQNSEPIVGAPAFKQLPACGAFLPPVGNTPDIERESLRYVRPEVGAEVLSLRGFLTGLPGYR